MTDVQEHLVFRIDDQVAAVGDRIRPDKLAQADRDNLPAVVYNLIAEDRSAAAVMGSADSGDVDALFQVDIYDNTEAERSTVGDAVRSALQRYSGTHSGHVISQTFIEDSTDDYLDADAMFRRRLSVRVWYKE